MYYYKQFFPDETIDALESARKIAILNKSNVITPTHIILGILEQNNCAAIKFLEKNNINIEKLKKSLEKQMKSKFSSSEIHYIETKDVVFTEESENVLNSQKNSRRTDTLGLFYRLYKDYSPLINELSSQLPDFNKFGTNIRGEYFSGNYIYQRQKLLFSDFSKPANKIEEEIEKLKKELNTLQESNSKQRLDFGKINASLSRISESGNEIKAKVLFPSPRDMSIQLVPSQYLERLEEYRNDENIAFLLLGGFLGGLIGVLSNAYSNNIVILGYLYNFCILLGITTIISGIWVITLRNRMKIISKKIFRDNFDTTEQSEDDI